MWRTSCDVATSVLTLAVGLLAQWGSKALTASDPTFKSLSPATHYRTRVYRFKFFSMWCSWSVQAWFGTMTRADLQRFSNSREAHHPQQLAHQSGSGPKLSSFHGTRNNICTPGRHPKWNSQAVTCLTTIKHRQVDLSLKYPKMPFRFIFSLKTYLLEISIEKEKLENTLCPSMPISLDGGY